MIGDVGGGLVVGVADDEGFFRKWCIVEARTTCTRVLVLFQNLGASGRRQAIDDLTPGDLLDLKSRKRMFATATQEPRRDPHEKLRDGLGSVATCKGSSLLPYPPSFLPSTVECTAPVH